MIEITVTLSGREDGGLRVYSDELPGLILSGSDPQAVMSHVWPAIQALSTWEKCEASPPPGATNQKEQ